MAANTAPSGAWKQEFYELKQKLLVKYAEPVRIDLQHIRKECWSCMGTGILCGSEYHNICWDCNGTGVYAEYWFELTVWQWGKYRFHTPGKKLICKPDRPVDIAGRTTKKRHPASHEAALWLLLFCIPLPVFWRRFSRSKLCDRRLHHPLTTLQQIVYDVQGIPLSIKVAVNRLKRKFRD